MPRKRPGVLLTDKQRTFCHEYVIDLHATNAAIRAGYSEESARSTASHLLDNREVQAFIRQLQEDKFLRLCIKADEVLLELARIGFARVEDFAEENELPKNRLWLLYLLSRARMANMPQVRPNQGGPLVTAKYLPMKKPEPKPSLPSTFRTK